MPRKESDLYKPILDWLNLQRGVKAWRNRNLIIGRCLAPHERGSPDILGVKKKSSGKNSWGQAFAFEVKAVGKEANKEQRLWLEDFTDCGGVGYIVDSLDNVIFVFTDI